MYQRHDPTRDVEDVTELRRSHRVLGGERLHELGPHRLLQPPFQVLHALRGVLELRDGPDHLERPSHGRDDVRHGPNVARREDIVGGSHEFTQARGFTERIPGELHSPFDGVDVPEAVDARA